MDRQPQERAGEAPGGARPESVDAAANRRRAVDLRWAAEEAGGRTAALRAAVAVRRGAGLSFRDHMAVWEETCRTLREMETTARELAAHDDEAEREAAEQTAWVRGQVESMLDAGWTRDELADIGIADELLAQVGMLHDPRLCGNAGTRPGRPAPEPRR